MVLIYASGNVITCKPSACNIGMHRHIVGCLICSNGTKTKLVRLLNSKGKALNPALQPQPDPNAEWRRLDAEASAGGRRNRRRYGLQLFGAFSMTSYVSVCLTDLCTQ